MRRSLLSLLMLALLPMSGTLAQLRGHGGPVRAIAISADGKSAISGSFDQSAIIWSLESGAAIQVLRFHEGAVNAVAALPDGRFATAGEDGRAALWAADGSGPLQIFTGHSGPVSALAISPDGRWLATAAWDKTIHIHTLAGGEARVLAGHRDTIGALAFSADSKMLVSAGSEGNLRLLPLADSRGPLIITLPAPLNALAVARDGLMGVGSSDGTVQLFDMSGHVQQTFEALEGPVAALAFSPDGQAFAAAGPAGTVTAMTRTGARLFGSNLKAGPIWALAFARDGREILAGAGDRMIHRLDARTGQETRAGSNAGADDLPASLASLPGARVFAACVACHTLSPEGGNRAGPTLHGLFGRRIGSAAGYNFSPALKAMDIVWSASSVAKLFEVGPEVFTPGTKMPNQIIVSAGDRAALVEFLEKAGTVR